MNTSIKGYLTDQAKTWENVRKWAEQRKLSTANGPNSYDLTTIGIREWLPKVFERYGIKTMLDAPCGDWLWMQLVNLSGIDYTGYDIDEVAIKRNQKNFPQHEFSCVNLLTVEELPKVSLVMCRDLMIHLPDEMISLLLDKFKASGSHYLMATTFFEAKNGVQINEKQDHIKYNAREFNLEAEPFNLVGRLEHIYECEGTARGMALFRL